MGRVEQQLGHRVALQRKVAKLTQAALAEKVGVSDETISRLERGAAVPSLARLEQIATALGVGLDELFRSRRPRASSRDVAMDRLMSAVRNRSADELDLLAELALRLGD